MTKVSGYLAAATAVCALLCANVATAGRPSLAECFEGSDFIANAALARDAGMSSQAFLDRMQQDFEAIRAFPSELRWFVHDPDDEAFLLAAARDVFAHPGAPANHRRLFLKSCVDRMAGQPS
jgi:hypothetical protein